MSSEMKIKKSKIELKERDEKIAEMVVKTPGATLQGIGKIFGLTKERVRQILPSAIQTEKQKVYGRGREREICPGCQGKKASHGILCRACYQRQHWFSTGCNNCGQVIKIRKNRLIRKIKSGQTRFFCAKHRGTLPDNR